MVKEEKEVAEALASGFAVDVAAAQRAFHST